MATATKKDYAAIAKSKICKPQSSKRMPRVLVYARSKKGKTRLGTSAPNVLVIDPESGTDYETKANPDVWNLTSWEELSNEVYPFLRSGQHEYKWISLDGLTAIYDMALNFVRSQDEEIDLNRKPDQVKIQDYGKANKLVGGLLYNLHALSQVGIIITAQERTVEVNRTDDSDDEIENSAYMFVPDLPKGIRGTVNSIVDVIGRVYTVNGMVEKKVRSKADPSKIVTKKVEGTERRLWVSPHPLYDTGYRSGFILPDYISNPTIPRLITTMKEGKA